MLANDSMSRSNFSIYLLIFLSISISVLSGEIVFANSNTISGLRGFEKFQFKFSKIFHFFKVMNIRKTQFCPDSKLQQQKKSSLS